MDNPAQPPEPHPCIVARNADGTLEYDHEWEMIHDSNEGGAWCYWQCQRCDAEKEATDADLQDYD